MHTFISDYQIFHYLNVQNVGFFNYNNCIFVGELNFYSKNKESSVPGKPKENKH